VKIESRNHKSFFKEGLQNIVHILLKINCAIEKFGTYDSLMLEHTSFLNVKLNLVNNLNERTVFYVIMAGVLYQTALALLVTP
jgi:hypothetical protein